MNEFLERVERLSPAKRAILEKALVRRGARRDRDYSYALIDRQANRLAHWLKRRGVEDERPVGVCMARSAELVVAMLAVMKAGGAYLPLDPDQPARRLQFVLEDAKPALVLVGEEAIDIARDPCLGWGAWAEGGVEVHRIPGRHLDMIREPNVRVLAAGLSECLSRAEEEGT
jgi:non-ribosomal peptide synthetase component F